MTNFYAILKEATELFYNTNDLELTNLVWHTESTEYGACSFMMNGKKVEHRVSKITPTKIGQFVAIWKRNPEGNTVPFDILDNIDFIIITSKSDKGFGQFIFPKSVLANQKIISQNGLGGKRGIRVYPPWDKADNKQAQKTQQWQLAYFTTIKQDGVESLWSVKELFKPTGKQTT